MEQALGNLASIVGPLLLVGFALMLAGVMGRVGSGSISWDDLGTEAVAGLALLIVFCMLMATVSSSEWGEVFGALCGGIPIVDAIADYGSYRDVLQQDLRSAVVAFVDTFIMCLLMNLFKLLPPMISGGGRDSCGILGSLLLKSFTGMVCGIVALLFLNYVIKGSAPYQIVLSMIGGVLAALATASIPALVVGAIFGGNKPVATTVLTAGLLAGYVAFSKSYPMSLVRSALFQAVTFMACVYVLEGFYGSLANAAVFASNASMAFGPVLVILIGIGFLLKAVLK